MRAAKPRDYVHPTFVGDQTGGTGVSPAGWLVDNVRAWFSTAIDTLSRGTPAPMGPRDRWPIGKPYKEPQPWGNFHLALTRRFDRGALAYGYRFGAMSYDPLGGGVVTTRPMYPTLPAGNVSAGIGITWWPQSINFAVTPQISGPLLDPQTAAALMGNDALAGSIPQGVYIAPSENGFGG